MSSPSPLRRKSASPTREDSQQVQSDPQYVKLSEMRTQLVRIVEARPTNDQLGYNPQFEDFRNEQRDCIKEVTDEVVKRADVEKRK